ISKHAVRTVEGLALPDEQLHRLGQVIADRRSRLDDSRTFGGSVGNRTSFGSSEKLIELSRRHVEQCRNFNGHTSNPAKDSAKDLSLSIAKHVSCTLTSTSSVGKNRVRGLLTDHVHRAHDEETRDARKHRSVDDSQIASAVDSKIVSDDAAAVSWTDRARSARVMSPGMTLHELGELGFRLRCVSRDNFPGSDSMRANLVVELPDELDAVDHRLHIGLA